MSQIVIGTAGHIDHGKTALVKALTGTDTDRLVEEQKRGMTIDLGFAFLNADITIIDVPGHERFIRNMVAGVATIHIALVAIAADDGLMPQTIEHLNILEMLGITQGVIALTKTDLASDPEWLELVEREIRRVTKGTFLETAAIIRTSVNPESGVEDLRQELIRTAAQVRKKADRGFFRLPVDRVFAKKGFGIVVTGTVVSGRITKGGTVLAQPTGEKAKVRGLQSHGVEVESVSRGDRAAINLAGMEKPHLWRGCEIVEPGWLNPTRTVLAYVKLVGDTAWRLTGNQRIRIHIGTVQVLGRVNLLGQPALKAGEAANMQITFESPAAAAMDDRFVMRSYSPLDTIGGGVILDPHPALAGRALAEWARNLALDPVQRFRQFVERDWTRPRTVNDWQHIFQVPRERINDFIKAGHLEHNPETGMVYNPRLLEKSCRSVTDFLGAFHSRHPYRKAVARELIGNGLDFSPAWLELVCAQLLQENRITALLGGYALASHSINLSPKDQETADQLARHLLTGRYAPPTLPELITRTGITQSEILKLLHALKEQELCLEVEPGFWIHQRHWEHLVQVLKTHFRRQNTLSVSEFKDLTGTTRKTAIPLLEYCDSSEVTFRTGNLREAGKRLR